MEILHPSTVRRIKIARARSIAAAACSGEALGSDVDARGLLEIAARNLSLASLELREVLFPAEQEPRKESEEAEPEPLPVN
jgi:hypothetical protein